MLSCISFLFGPLRSKGFTEKDGIPCRCYGRFNCIIGYTYFLFCEVHQVPALFFFFFFFINVFIHVIFMNVFVRNCTLINFVTTRNKVILIILIFLIYYYFFLAIRNFVVMFYLLLLCHLLKPSPIVGVSHKKINSYI